MKIWIAYSEDTENMEFEAIPFANELDAYQHAAKEILGFAKHSWDDDESDLRDEDIIRVFSNNPTLKQCKEGISTFNNYSADNDFNIQFYVSDTELRGVPDAPKGVVYVPNPNGGNGCTCKKCGNFSEYAGPNFSDGTFMCAGCRIWEGIS